MKINGISLSSFRNYRQREFEFAEGVNVITGKNATGKTNLLEAIGMMCGIGSFRGAKRADLINWEEQAAFLSCSAFSRLRDFKLELTVNRAAPSVAKINGVKKTASEFSDVLKCVVFCPEDLFIVSSAPALRRDFLDRCIKNLHPSYHTLLQKYSKLMAGKAKILKNLDENPSMGDILPEYDGALIECCVRMSHLRHRLVKALSPLAAEAQKEISGGRDELFIEYSCPKELKSFDDLPLLREEMRANFDRLKNAEMASRSCLAGVHKDDVAIFVNGRNARLFASQGQTRTASLALKLSERELYRRDCGEYPLLLLDDVFSELDKSRREYIMESAGKGQVIITSCTRVDEIPASARVLSPSCDDYM